MEPEALRYAALTMACDFADTWPEAIAIADSFLDYMAGDAVLMVMSND